MNILFLASLTLHLLGLISLVGSVFIEYLIYRQFIRLYTQDAEKGLIVLSPARYFPFMSGIGFGVMILAGFGMLIAVKWAFASQLWFSIKMAVVILTFLNGVIFGRIYGTRMMKLLRQPAGEGKTEMLATAGKLQTFRLVQLSMYLVIIVLSAFKFV